MGRYVGDPHYGLDLVHGALGVHHREGHAVGPRPGVGVDHDRLHGLDSVPEVPVVERSDLLRGSRRRPGGFEEQWALVDPLTLDAYRSYGRDILDSHGETADCPGASSLHRDPHQVETRPIVGVFHLPPIGHGAVPQVPEEPSGDLVAGDGLDRE